MKQTFFNLIFSILLVTNPLLLISQNSKDIPNDQIDIDHIRQNIPQPLLKTTTHEWLNTMSKFLRPYFPETQKQDTSRPTLLKSDLNKCFLIINPKNLDVFFIYKNDQKTEFLHRKISEVTNIVLGNIGKISFTMHPGTESISLKSYDFSHLLVVDSFPEFPFQEKGQIVFTEENNSQQVLFLFDHSFYTKQALDMATTLVKNWVIKTDPLPITAEELICLNFRHILQTFSYFVSIFDSLEPSQESQSKTHLSLPEKIAYLKWFDFPTASNSRTTFLSEYILFHSIYVPLEYLLRTKNNQGPDSSSAFVMNQFQEKNWVHYSLLLNKYDLDLEKFLREFPTFIFQMEARLNKNFLDEKQKNLPLNKK